MGEVVNIKPTRLEDNAEFVADCCRYREKILTEAAVKKKWKFDAATWERLGEDDALIAEIEAEQVRRIRTGQQKRERAQVLVVAAPNVLSDILNDPQASPRHRIDSAKALDDFAANGPEGTPPADRFQITINLGGDVIERYDKSIAISADDTVPGKAMAHKTKRIVEHKPPETRLNMDGEDGGTVREVE